MTSRRQRLQPLQHVDTNLNSFDNFNEASYDSDCELINMSGVVSSHVHTTSSDLFSPVDIAQKISFPTTPLTVTPTGTQLVQNIALVAGAKRKLDFDSDDFQQSNSQLDKSLEKDIQAQASQPTDDLSEKQKTSASIKKEMLNSRQREG